MEMTRIGASTASLARYDLPAAIRRIAELGFDNLELLAFEEAEHSQGALAGFWFDRHPERELDELRSQLQGFRGITTHAPFIDLPLFTHNPGMRAEALRQLEACIEGTGSLGGTVTAVHAHPRRWRTLEESWDEMVTTFRRLGDVGVRCGVCVAIETMYPPTVDRFLQLIHEIDHKNVGATVDVGHVAWTVPVQLRGTPEGVRLYNDNLVRLVEGLGPGLRHFHVHDVRCEDWRDHRAVGRGCVDWKRLAGVLRRLDCRGNLVLELEEPDREQALIESREHLRRCMEPSNPGRGQAVRPEPAPAKAPGSGPENLP